MKKYNAAIFDIDGTLLDTSEGIIEAIRHTIAKLNLSELSNEHLRSFMGRGTPIQAFFNEQYNLSPFAAQNAADIFRNYYKDVSLFKAKLYNGVYDVFNVIYDSGVKIGIATYKRQDYTIDIMRRFDLDKYLTAVCGADNENRLKKVDIIKNCLNKLEIAPSEAVMIGDSYHDANGSAEAGLDFIAVLYGFGFQRLSDLNGLSYDGVCESVGEILKYVL